MASVFENAGAHALDQQLRDAGINFTTAVPLAEYSYLRTGGTAHFVIKPSSVQQLAATVALLHRSSDRYKVIGNTSNLLFKDDEDYSILISTRGLTSIDYDANTGLITAQCGVMMPDLSRIALWNGRRGFEGLEGIPGTIGGGLFMNAGAYGHELVDFLDTVEVIHPDGRLETVPASALGLRHRGSAIRSGEYPVIVARAIFRTEPGDQQKLYRKMEVYHAARHKYQDYMYPNLGSIFSGSPYRALGKLDMKFRIQSALFYFFRYQFRIFHRESPINRKWLNDRVLERFDLNYVVQPFSDKTLNCLVNRGQGTNEMIRFIRQMEAMVGNHIPTENEVVDSF